MKTVSAILASALLVAPSVAHVAIKPPSPDKWLTPNSSTAPPGCKLLASDKGFPTEEEVLKLFPKAFRKMKGTEGPDFWVQPQSVEDVQKAVNFAREKNIRLNIITTGHDFHGREDSRSGLRLDMASLVWPTVFSNEWKCGDTLKPTVNGRVVEDVVACKVPNQKRNVGRGNAARTYDWKFFEKRDAKAPTCSTLLKSLEKRHGPDMDDHAEPNPKAITSPTEADSPPVDDAYKFDTEKPWEWGQKTGFQFPTNAQIVDGHNKITLTGKFAYARIPAGMYNEKFYMQAHDSGLMTLGAQHGGVSVLGGWMQAGGHNPFANRVGMMVDNVVELEVVTPDGAFQKVSECNNPELFWALRGGGGSTFGVVVGGTVKVYPTFPVTVSRFMVNVTKPYDPKIFKATAHFLQRGATLRDKYGLQGYFYVYPNGFHSVLHMPGDYAALANAKKVTEEIMGEMEKITGEKHIEPKYYEHKSYKDWYVAEMGDEEMEESGKKAYSWYDGSWGDAPSSEDVMMNPMLLLPYRLAEAKATANKTKRDGAAHSVLRSQPMGRTYLDSRLLSDKHVNSVKLEELADVIDKTFPRITANHIRGFLYGGGEMAKPKASDMGLLPQWRDMTYHFIVNALPGSTRHDFHIRAFDKLFPDAGAYVNEAAPGEPNWKEKFWGANYARLETIKKVIDPHNVLWCSPCVGADLLSYDDERLCKNPNYPQAGESPQTYPDEKSKTGIASLPGKPGIPNPLAPIIAQYMKNKTLPEKMPASGFFKMAMGQGGSSGGKWALGPPGAKAAAEPEHGHGSMGDMGGMSHGDAPKPETPKPEAPKEEAPKEEAPTPEPAATTPAPATTPEPKAPTVPSPAAPKSSGTFDLGSILGGLGKTGSGTPKTGSGTPKTGTGKTSKGTRGKSTGTRGKGSKGTGTGVTSKTGKASNPLSGLLGGFGISREEESAIERLVTPGNLI